MLVVLYDYTFLMCMLVDSGTTLEEDIVIVSDTMPDMIIFGWLKYYDQYDTKVGFKFCEKIRYEIDVP